MPKLQWIRTNNVALNIQLTNWIYRTSDKLRLFVQQASKGTGNWPAVLALAISDPNLYLQYNYYSNRSVMNVQHGRSYSGDSMYSYDSVNDFTSFYMFELDGSNFTINKGTSFNNLSPIVQQSLGTATDTDLTAPYLYPTNGNNLPDHVFYRLAVYRAGELIHDYRPYSGGVIDIIDGTTYLTSGAGYIDGPPAVPSYTIMYNANGGRGTMAPQNAPIDEDVTLTACTFTYIDATFLGWGTSASGPVVYPDEATVRNLAGEDETVTLYAIWDRALYIELQHNASENIKLDKTLNTILHCAGKLREECTITAPDILVDAPLDVVLRCNYCTVPLFGRSFFINNVTADTNNLVRIHCTVDAVSSFKAEIRANKGIVRRSEKLYNLNINDGSLVAYQNPYVLTEPFPSGFTGASFVLATAGA